MTYASVHASHSILDAGISCSTHSVLTREMHSVWVIQSASPTLMAGKKWGMLLTGQGTEGHSRYAYNVGQRAPACSDDLQHGVSSGCFALDFNGKNAKQQDLYGRPGSIPAVQAGFIQSRRIKHAGTAARLRPS